MSIAEQFSTALSVFRAFEKEHGRSREPIPAPPAPDLDQVLEQTGTLPAGTVLLGLADDGVPLVLNLYDPLPGAILVAGDRGCGKTGLLRMMASAADRMPGADDVQFGVITHATEEWLDLEALPGCMGVWPSSHAAAGNYLDRLVYWGQHPQNDGRTVVMLLIDGLDALLLSDGPAAASLRWLLSRGPRWYIWPVATFNAGRLPRFLPWMERFGMHIFGSIRQANLAEALTADPAVDLAMLFPGLQFAMSRPDGDWMKFWIPAVDMERRAS